MRHFLTMELVAKPIGHEAIAAELKYSGWTIRTGFIGRGLPLAPAVQAQRRPSAGAFHRPGVGRGRV